MRQKWYAELDTSRRLIARETGADSSIGSIGKERIERHVMRLWLYMYFVCHSLTYGTNH